MSAKLQQAIQATRAGDKKNAQFLLTQAIQEDPDNPQSWYLLSLLVDDKEKKQTYLMKVIELDPDHAKAHEQLVTITETAVLEPVPVDEAYEIEDIEPEMAAVVLSSGSSDLESQDEGATLPDWMADDLPPINDEDQGLLAETAVIDVVIEEEVVPDWLDGSLDENWDGEEKTAVDETVPDGPKDKQPETKAVVNKKETAAKEKKPAKPKASSEDKLNYVLMGLILFVIIIIFILGYLIVNM